MSEACDLLRERIVELERSYIEATERAAQAARAVESFRARLAELRSALATLGGFEAADDSLYVLAFGDPLKVVAGVWPGSLERMRSLLADRSAEGETFEDERIARWLSLPECTCVSKGGGGGRYEGWIRCGMCGHPIGTGVRPSKRV